MQRLSKAFVASEPLIVLSTFALACLLAGWGVASLMGLSFAYGLVMALIAFCIGIGIFAAYARLNRSE